jgi:hypothetical protein
MEPIKTRINSLSLSFLSNQELKSKANEEQMKF